MTALRFPLALTLAAIFVLPVAVAAQDGVEASAAPATPVATADTRLAELEALVPESFAGLPLREDMQLAPGELLTSRMDDDERSVFEAMLEANGKTLADYAAANVPVRIDDANVIIIQPHRVTGIDAAATLDAWAEILSLNAKRPAIDETVIAGREVVLVSDAARPELPVLHLFAVDDVVWMVVAEDELVIEEAVRSLPASSDT